MHRSPPGRKKDTATVTNVVGSPIHFDYYSCGRIFRLGLIQFLPWEANCPNENLFDGLDTIDIVNLDKLPYLEIKYKRSVDPILIHIEDLSEFDVLQAKLVVG